jgi:ADP-heptose:LPS heptosyltransferase
MNSVGGQKLKWGRELFLYYHGIGDSLLFNTVLYHYGRQTNQKFIVGSPHPEIYAGNPYVRHLPFTTQFIVYRLARLMRWTGMVDGLTHMDYYHGGRIPQKHIMHLLAERIGLKEMPAKPLIFLSKQELAKKILPDAEKPWVAIQSIGNTKWTDNKNWGAEKFARLAELLSPSFSLVQMGTAADPPLPVQMNLCGKVDVRGVFQVLGQCAGFVGLEGFLMHAATAMGVASVIVYGGFTAPWQTGYEINANLFTPVPCAPCWLESRCPYDKKCMEAITPSHVADALTEKLRKGTAMISKV